MIRGSLIAGALAMGVSALAHVGGLSALWHEQPVLIEGGAEVAVARLGNSFRDVAAGEMTPETAPEPLTPEAVEEPLTQLKPVETARMTPVDPLPPETTAKPAPQATRQPLTTLAPVAAASPLKPVAQSQIAARTPTDTPLAQTPEPQVLAALPEQTAIAPQLSSRPSVRPRSVEQAAAKRQPKPKKQAKAKPQKTQKKTARKSAKKTRKKTAKKVVSKAPKGTAKKAETKGSAQGQRQAKATAKAGKKGRKAKAAGNAAASNYPGIVMRKIQRRKPRTNIRGTAVVSFSIARSGGLAALSLAKSSGSPKLDKLALSAVRRAAPFPRPPAGARTRFTLPVKGR